MSRNKYGAVAVECDGFRFDSKAEYQHYLVLASAARRGVIHDLTVHRRFPLVVNGQRVASYEADFTYIENGVLVVEDVKSKATLTQVYKLKKRLMAVLHGIDVREVMT